MNILIVDPHHRMRWLLADVIRIAFEPSPVLEAADADTALKLCCDARPELVLVAVAPGEGVGMDLVAVIMSKLPQAKLVVLAQHSNLEGAARRAGAAAFLLKDEVFGKLISLLKQVVWRPHGEPGPAEGVFCV